LQAIAHAEKEGNSLSSDKRLAKKNHYSGKFPKIKESRHIPFELVVVDHFIQLRLLGSSAVIAIAPHLGLCFRTSRAVISLSSSLPLLTTNSLLFAGICHNWHDTADPVIFYRFSLRLLHPPTCPPAAMGASSIKRSLGVDLTNKIKEVRPF
jgi:hypothetical protein